MEEKVKSLLAEIGISAINNAEEAEQFRLKYLSKKGIIPALFEEFKTLAPEQRKAAGKILNELKQAAELKHAEAKAISEQTGSGVVSNIDLTLPSDPIKLGSRHPYLS